MLYGMKRKGNCAFIRCPNVLAYVTPIAPASSQAVTTQWTPVVLLAPHVQPRFLSPPYPLS